MASVSSLFFSVLFGCSSSPASLFLCVPRPNSFSQRFSFYLVLVFLFRLATFAFFLLADPPEDLIASYERTAGLQGHSALLFLLFPRVSAVHRLLLSGSWAGNGFFCAGVVWTSFSDTVHSFYTVLFFCDLFCFEFLFFFRCMSAYPRYFFGPFDSFPWGVISSCVLWFLIFWFTSLSADYCFPRCYSSIWERSPPKKYARYSFVFPCVPVFIVYLFFFSSPS